VALRVGERVKVCGRELQPGLQEVLFTTLLCPEPYVVLHQLLPLSVQPVQQVLHPVNTKISGTV